MIHFIRNHSGPIVFALACLYTLAMCAIHQHNLDLLFAHVAELEQLERTCGGSR